MIVYFVKGQHDRETVRDFLDTWGKVLAHRFHVVRYEELDGHLVLPRGTYAFSDLERLGSEELERAAELHQRLTEVEPPVRILNRPLRSKRRYELLDLLHRERINDFRAYRLEETWNPRRFPVFLRLENQHNGPETGLLNTPGEVETEIARLWLKGVPLRDVLIVEFVDTSDSRGLFRKYGAFVVDGQIVPRHLYFSRTWAFKEFDLLEPENPHQAALAEIARLPGDESAICPTISSSSTASSLCSRCSTTGQESLRWRSISGPHCCSISNR